MSNKLNHPAQDRAVFLNGKVIYQADLFENVADFNLCRLVVVTAAKFLRKIPQSDRMSIVQEIACMVMRAKSYSANMDEALAQRMVSDALNDVRRKVKNKTSKSLPESFMRGSLSVDVPDYDGQDSERISLQSSLDDPCECTPLEIAESRIDARKLRSFIRRLNAKEQECLGYFEKGYNYEQMGPLVGMSASVARRLTLRAIRKLRKMMLGIT